ncbi:hypothetical protein Angca_008812 [Angiostrongylus cantonensis]|nr:hypothetical protein Angca_008812 [Angiostrongylus cantonensis]
MKRAPKSKMASLYYFWTSDQQQNTNDVIRNQAVGRIKFFFRLEVITLSGSPLEHINATPLPAFGSQHSPGGNVPTWAPLLRRSTTSDPCPSSKSVPTPLRRISPASEAELEKAGFDPREGSTIRYPANEYCRQYEIDIVKLCTAENSAVCLPLAISANHICAVVVMNFLRWFPRSRAIFCCSSLEAAHLFEERCKAIGIPLEEVSIVDTFNTFKKKEARRIGRLVVTTPQALEKIIESNSSFVCDIRCVVLSLDAYEGSRLTKCRNIVGVLTVKGIIFRVILVTPSVPSTSRKLKPLRNRQQIITSLIISQWIEPSALDPSFRSSAVPSEISVDYYSTTDGTSELISFTEKWIEASVLRVVLHLEKLHTLILLPSTKPQQLFTIDWTPIIAVRCRRWVLNTVLPPFRQLTRSPPHHMGTSIKRFLLQNESIILVVDIEIPNFVNVVDTICSSQLQVVVSMDRRYNFSYEFSRLQLPSSKMEFVQYIPVTLCSVLDMKAVSCSRRYGFELTSAELNEFSDRLSALPVVDRGSYDRNSRLAFLSSCYDISKMSLNGSFGNVPSSTLRKRLMDCLNGNDFIKKRKKRRYKYTEELVDKKRIEFYDEMIEKLNQLLTI